MSSLIGNLVSAILGGLVAGVFTLYVAKYNYINSYYKTILQKRLHAYELVENLIAMLKTCVVENDECPYHVMFLNTSDGSPFNLLLLISSQAMWLSEEIIEETTSLSRLLYSVPTSSEDVIEFAKTHYQEIAETRTCLERYSTKDFLNLHNIKAFLKSKKHIDSYVKLSDVK